jgi:ABC-2 type transport system ATP-binding protein
MIIAEGLSKRYGPTTAVNNISFTVGKGEIVGFLGPNGAGKTTTMRMLTCYMPPTAGRAEVAGFDIASNPEEVKRRIGYLPETPPVYPEMTIAEYLDFVAKLKGVRGAAVRNKVSEALEKCAITDVKDKLIQKLSKGYRQRVGLAQAIIHNPEVLILDEPTSGFDPKQINETRDLIRSLAGEHTIILSTHILSEVESMCEKVIIINKGRLAATDSVANLTERMRGGEAIRVEFAAPRGQHLDAATMRGKLELIPGVGKVRALDEGVQAALRFDVDLIKTEDNRAKAEIARAVVQSGYDLTELRTLAYSLEEVFLQLTSTVPGRELIPPSEKALAAVEEQAE